MSTSSELSDVVAARECALAELRAADKVIVATHEHLDGDAIGSLVAMQAVLTALGKDTLSFLPEEDLPLSYEYRSLELKRLVTKAPEDIDERTIVFLDCGAITRNAAALALRPDTGFAQILNIDHHHDNTRFGDCNYVDPGSSSTAELIWDMLHTLDVELTPTISAALYVALITDTGCFMYENTGPRAHQMAADLIEAGIDVYATYQQVYEGVPFGKLALLARGLAHVERHDDGRLIVSQLSAEDFEAAGAEETYSEGVIDHLRAVRGAAMAALARDRLDGSGGAVHTADGARIRKVSLRAVIAEVDVSAIARELGGGGHRAAAGFTTSLPWDELVSFLRQRLDRQLSGR